MNQSDTQQPLSRKEREKLTRQQEMLKAARALFVTKGFRETTLEEIARYAEFGKGTIYNYFANKEDLFVGMLDQVIDESIQIARESMATPGNLRDKLRLYARTMIRHISDNGEVLHVVYHELHRSDAPESSVRLRECIQRARGSQMILAEQFVKAVQNRTVRDVDPEQLASLFDSLLRGYCIHRLAIEQSHVDEDSSAAAEFLTTLFFDGIAEREGRG